MEQQLIDALTALTGQMTITQQAQATAQQQLHDDLLAQQQTQQNLIDQLATIQGQAPQVVQQQGPRSSAVSTIPHYSGQTTDSLADWLSILNRTALAEGWADDVKRRVAVGKLIGPALQWQDLTGNGHALWADWLAALQATFRPRLSLVEWCLQVERRVQLPTEPGAQYALEKMKICRLCPHQLPDAEIVNYLSKGLYYPDQRAILLANPPANLDAFITRIRDLEAVGGSALGASTTPATIPLPPVAATLPANTADLAAVLKNFGEQLTQSVREMRSIYQSQASWRPPAYGTRPAVQGTTMIRPPTRQPFENSGYRPSAEGAYFPRPRLPVSEITCFNCTFKGHYARDCPEPPRSSRGGLIAAYSTPQSENETAAPWGQERPEY